MLADALREERTERFIVELSDALLRLDELLVPSVVLRLVSLLLPLRDESERLLLLLDVLRAETPSRLAIEEREERGDDERRLLLAYRPPERELFAPPRIA